jgi:hypothetical protein
MRMSHACSTWPWQTVLLWPTARRSRMATPRISARFRKFRPGFGAGGDCSNASIAGNQAAQRRSSDRDALEGRQLLRSDDPHIEARARAAASWGIAPSCRFESSARISRRASCSSRTSTASGVSRAAGGIVRRNQRAARHWSRACPMGVCKGVIRAVRSCRAPRSIRRAPSRPPPAGTPRTSQGCRVGHAARHGSRTPVLRRRMPR